MATHHRDRLLLELINFGVDTVLDQGGYEHRQLCKDAGYFSSRSDHVYWPTVKRGIEEKLGNEQLVPMGDRWWLFKAGKLKESYSPELHPEKFVAAGTKASGYMRIAHIPFELQKYWLKIKDGAVAGADNSRQRFVKSAIDQHAEIAARGEIPSIGS